MQLNSQKKESKSFRYSWKKNGYTYKNGDVVLDIDTKRKN